MSHFETPRWGNKINSNILLCENNGKKCPIIYVKGQDHNDLGQSSQIGNK